MSGEIRSYRDLIVWHKAMDLCEMVYGLVGKLPVEERYVLSGQMRRSSVSIPSNIAEGRARQGKKEFPHFLSIAQGSIAELETQVLLAVRMKFFGNEDAQKALDLADEVSKMLKSLKNRLTNQLRF